MVKQKQVRSVFYKIATIVLLMIIYYILQHTVNYLSYQNNLISRNLTEWLGQLGLEEEHSRFLLWYTFLFLLSIACIKLVFRKPLQDIGFNLHIARSDLKVILGFVFGYTMLVIVSRLLIYLLWGLDPLIAGVQDRPVGFIVKDILFFGLLPGPSEEPFFRIFVIQFLCLVTFKGEDAENRKTRVWIVLISALLFVYGHIYVVSWLPFNVQYNGLTLLTALVLGFFYAVIYLRTKSIAIPMICHNYSDFIYRAGVYLLFFADRH